MHFYRLSTEFKIITCNIFITMYRFFCHLDYWLQKNYMKYEIFSHFSVNIHTCKTSFSSNSQDAISTSPILILSLHHFPMKIYVLTIFTSSNFWVHLVNLYAFRNRTHAYISAIKILCYSAYGLLSRESYQQNTYSILFTSIVEPLLYFT